MSETHVFVIPQDRNYFLYGKRYENDENSSIVDEFMEASVKGDDEEDKEQAVEVEGKIVVVPLSDGTEEIRLQRGGTFLRLELEKSDLSDFSYFSGMNVKLNVVPASAGSINVIVKSVVPFESLPMAVVIAPEDLLRVFLAFGPIVNTDFACLELFLDKVVSSSVSALIMSGPFYDLKNAENALEQTQKALRLISTKLESTNTKVLILPNALQDVLSLPTFPTPELEEDLIGLSELKNLQFVSDPATILLNGVTFLITNSEPISNLSRLERYHGTVEHRERMAKLCEHLLDQNSVCPVKYDEASKVVNDVNTCPINERPHFFIVPSKLGVMSKVVQNVVFINPGRFVAGNKLRYTEVDINIFRGVRNNAVQIGFGQFSSINHETMELPKES